MPPAAADDDAFGDDLAVADQVLADDVLIVELALLHRDQRGVADAARLEAAESSGRRKRRSRKRSPRSTPRPRPTATCPCRGEFDTRSL